MYVLILTSTPTTNIAANWNRLVSPVFGEDDVEGVATIFLYTCTLSPFASERVDTYS